jgi:hypothetical protein
MSVVKVRPSSMSLFTNEHIMIQRLFIEVLLEREEILFFIKMNPQKLQLGVSGGLGPTFITIIVYQNLKPHFPFLSF